MRIFLHNYKAYAKYVLRKCGYAYRTVEKDYIREDGKQGRFYAKDLDKKAIEIHYDMYVEWRHVSFNMPAKHNEEKWRIMRSIRHLKDREMKPSEWSKLQKKYG